MKKMKFLSLFYTFLALFFSSCSMKTKEFSSVILLYNLNIEELKNGEEVKIVEENAKKEELKVTYKNKIYKLKTWQVEKFQNREELASFKQNFSKLSNVFVITKKNLIPLREKPNNYEDNIIMRVPINSIFKVINIGAKTKAGNLEGSWYEVLSQDGRRGFLFDYYIEEFKQEVGKIIAREILEKEKTTILKFLENNKYFRPSYYKDLIDSKYVEELETINDTFGLFFIPENTIFINTKEFKFRLNFKEVLAVRPNGYLFREDESYILIKKLNEREINVLVKEGQNTFKGQFRIIEESLENIKRELKNHNLSVINKLSSFKNLENSFYGKIQFERDNSFIWKKGEKSEKGTFRILGLNPKLQFSYKTSLELKNENGELSYYLIDYTKNALQLVKIKKENIKSNIAIKDGKNESAIIFQELN